MTSRTALVLSGMIFAVVSPAHATQNAEDGRNEIGEPVWNNE